jgi:ParB/RepB/Spo0J family partition protein
LRESIKQDGIQQPLIVRPATDRDVYHITDGWQRYQAATSLGWEQLPVSVYETPLAALAATETASIVREWSTYEWAQYCHSIASEVDEPVESRRQLACRVAERTARSPQTVRRYLDAVSLPRVIHPLLHDGPEGSEQAWQALENHNSRVRQYKGLSWRVGARLGRQARTEDVAPSRLIAIAANVVEYDGDKALTFVDRATATPDVPLQSIDKQIQKAGRYDEHLHVPSVTVTMDADQREAIMAYCADQRQPLSALIEAHIQSLATELVE